MKQHRQTINDRNNSFPASQWKAPVTRKANKAKQKRSLVSHTIVNILSCKRQQLRQQKQHPHQCDDVHNPKATKLDNNRISVGILPDNFKLSIHMDS